jgi:shikimate dehydrogenase
MKLYGLIGYPLGHSFSKQFFSKKFSDESIQSKYEFFELKSIEDFPDLIQKNKLSGLNVTIPYKESVIPFLDEIDETAKEIGAVNVIKFSKKNNNLVLKGYNSDYIGFTKSISPYLKKHHSYALILGSGGASKAIDFALKKMRIHTVFVSRNPIKNQIHYSDITPEIMAKFTVIVNTTPLGMFPEIDKAPAIPYDFITSKHLLFDAIYNPEKTKFLQIGEEKGATIINGTQMLIEQALAAWEIWNV